MAKNSSEAPVRDYKHFAETNAVPGDLACGGEEGLVGADDYEVERVEKVYRCATLPPYPAVSSVRSC